jgi:hypothetical protein
MLKKILKKMLRRVSGAIANNVLATTSERMDDLALLTGAHASFTVGQLKTLQTLADAEFKVFSQWGEDGIIEWLISKLPQIPTSFIEFGVQSYSESNTRFLTHHRNWRGLIMDCSVEYMENLRKSSMYWRFDLTAVTAFVDRDNINGLIRDNGYAGDLGILSIDIDSTDYWVWDAITTVNPWIVIAEYNAVFGDLRALTIPYAPTFDRMAAHPSGLYWGASIGALTQLAEKRGYSLLGTNRAGCNAFFIRKDLLPLFEGAITDRSPRPSLYRESRSADGTLTYVAGSARGDMIADAMLVDVHAGQTLRMGDAGELYSARWKTIMGVN